MEQKTLMKESYINNIHTAENIFLKTNFKGFQMSFLFGESKKTVVYSGL